MKMKNLIRGCIALIGLMLSIGAFAGDVYEFIADSVKEVSYSAGDEITFRMRLLTPNLLDGDNVTPKEDRTPWVKVADMNNPTVLSYFNTYGADHFLAALNADYPLQIGLVVNRKSTDGQNEPKTIGATLVTAEVLDDATATDFTFRYPVQAGDFALPLRLAADEKGTPINAGKWNAEAPETSKRYFFYNFDIWTITTASNDVFVAEMVSQATAQAASAEIAPFSPYNGNGDYLRTFNYRAETLMLDDETIKGDDGNEYWRVIRGSKSYPSEPRLTTVDDDLNITENGMTVYAWVAPGGGDDSDPSTWSWPETEAGEQYAVTIPLSGTKVSQETFQDPDGSNRVHNVYMFTLSPGTTAYTFPLKGKTVGSTARVVLSSYRHWNKIGSTGKFVSTDYRLKTVYCGEQKPTLSVTLDDHGNPATFPNANHEMTDYTKVERLRVTLEGVDSHPAFKVKLGFDLNGKTAFPTNIIAVSTDKAAGFLTKNLLSGMEVTFAENASESTESEEGLYLFVLGATKDTLVSPGIEIRPYAQAGAPAIQSTNSLYVVIKGMNPVITKPVGTADKPAPDIIIRGGGTKEVEVNLVDSYRNLNLSDAEASNACYTVVWTPGNGLSNQIITNDVNGLPLKPDSYGQLNFTVSYPKNDATNLASFYVINPEGLKSYWEDDDGKQYAESYVNVVVTRPATATAEFSYAGATGDTFNEGLELDVAFSLDQPDLKSRDLYAFLQPCNEAASNRCSAAFITEDKDGVKGSKGVLLWNQQGKTDDTTGGLKLLDGPGNPQPKFRVVLCTSQEYDPAKVVTDYETKELLVKILNIDPVVTKVRMEGSSRYINSSGATSDVVRLNVERDFTIKGLEDVAADLNAADDKQVVLRWRLYELDGTDENVEPNEVVYTVGKDSVYTMPGLDISGMKKIVLEVQDKDMRPYGEVRPIVDPDDPSVTNGWKYVMDKEDEEHDWWEDDENKWGPEFVIYVPVSDKPVVNVSAVGGVETLGGLQVFSESQLPPFSTIVDPNMGFLVTLSEGCKSSSLRVKLELQYMEKPTEQRPSAEGLTGVVSNGYVTVGVTNLVFNKNSTTSGSKTRNVQLTDFDGTWRDDIKRKGYAIWRLKATVYDPASATEDKKEGYTHGACDFYVRNEAPNLNPESKYEECRDPSGAMEVAKNGTVTIGYTVDDIESDMTNAMKVVCSVKGGEVVGEATHLATNGVSVASGEFTVRFTAEATNSVTITATDKDFDSSVIKLYFFVEETNTLLLYPAKPTTPSTDSDDIADYFSAAGIGYGRVWASSQLQGIQYWIQTRSSPKSGGSAVLAYAKGYAAGEREQKNSADYPAFVSDAGDDVGATGYKTPLDTLDSFFYRWFAKISSESASSGTWTAYKPVPQLSTNTTIVAAQTVLSLAFPSGDDVKFNDISALAVFSREYLWSDNMGDINADGVPDSYVVKYKLTDGDYTSGNDLKDVNYGTDGTTPNCLDYLPLTELARYSSLIPSLSGEGTTDNIKNAKAFTPRLKLRGYHDGLNDATAASFPDGVSNQAYIDGAKPEKVYEVDDGEGNMIYDAEKCTISELEYLAWREYKTAHPDATFDSWSPERPTDPTKADTDNDGFTDGYEYYYWYRAHVGYMDGADHKYLTGRAYDPRNPGQGVFISSEEIKALMDPLVSSAENSDTRDTDNDGLPDLLEFEIGTNPFDFDTDGDGLPDGWELMIAGLNPLLAQTGDKGPSDPLRNYDGDAMAISSYILEQLEMPVPKKYDFARLTTFAVIDPDGDTDGVQWYAVKSLPTTSDGSSYICATTNKASVWGFKIGSDHYVSTNKPVVTADGFLAADVPFGEAFLSEVPVLVPQWTNEVVESEGQIVTNTIPLTNELGVAISNLTYNQRYPVRLLAGTWIDVSTISTQLLDNVQLSISTNAAAATLNTAWVYGRGSTDSRRGVVAATAASYGCLALGRPKTVAKGLLLATAPSQDRDVAFLHYLCYQEFGFDPRTAWNPNTPLASRWGKKTEDQVLENYVVGNYVGSASRTRPFYTYDEFLLASFFVNNGCDLSAATYSISASSPDLALFWGALTTNPQGPNEPTATTLTSDNSASYYYGRNSTNGADTDGDGVPDGWELYVMSGPKSGDPKKPEYRTNEKYVHPAVYGEIGSSLLSPFVPMARDVKTCNKTLIGTDPNMTEYAKFRGTDSTAYYSVAQTGNASAFSTTIVHDDEWTWFNKFFPCDPWSEDTDDDGVKDVDEKSAFKYGSPADNGSLRLIPGGGLNPLSMDTDNDGLPDKWEVQFTGTTPYTRENATKSASGEALIDFAKDANGSEIGNALQGLMDGMDGTVADAFSYPITYSKSTDGASSNVTSYVSVNGVKQVVNRDYDHDGLENWQEYLTGQMRSWRYDDPNPTGRARAENVDLPFKALPGIPEEYYWDIDEETGARQWNPKYEKLGLTGELDKFGAFWYKTLIDKSSGIYNPMLVSGGQTLGQYLTYVRNVWDSCYTDSGTWLWLYDRVNDEKISETWIYPKGPWLPKSDFSRAPSKYACCSPLNADSDRDGMDDYYELFHGMNPLLGKKDGGRLVEDGPCDLIADAWANSEGKGIQGWAETDTYCANYWQEKVIKKDGSASYDFINFPWLSGIADADPDGDTIPNQQEALMPKLSKLAFHTDPTPLWMTDSSYAKSIVRCSYRFPTRFETIQPGIGENSDPGVFVYGVHTNYFVDCPGWVGNGETGGFAAPAFDKWNVAAQKKVNWMFSFEENEGYDSDHDGLSDEEELDGLFGTKSEPQKANDPMRRQAMYFQGPEKPSILQTPAAVAEQYPVYGYVHDPCFAQFTAECWVRPESLNSSIILERAVWTGVSSPDDKEFMRKNFQLGIQNDGGEAYWYAKFDPVGTAGEEKEVRVVSKTGAKMEWTHLAATYDGSTLILYVNGKNPVTQPAGLPASWGASVVAVTGTQSYWFDLKHELRAIIVGAGAKTQQTYGITDGNALDLSQAVGFDAYTGFFKGWIDEIRIWDGARTATEIAANVNVRFSNTEAAENRTTVYSSWSKGLRRYQKDGTGKDVTMPAELRYHWSFDAALGAENETALARFPHGFDGARPTLSRPANYTVNWWKAITDAYTGSLFSGSDWAWVPWLPNTVAHLPRFDGTTLDSIYWSADFQGDTAGTYTFVNEGEPVSFWSQMIYNAYKVPANKLPYLTTGSHHLMINKLASENQSNLALLNEFSIRNRTTVGDDLLPLGGAYARYCDNKVGLWDGQGASDNHEVTGADTDGDGLPDWWEQYADENYRGTLDPSVAIGWKTKVLRNGTLMTAGEAYLRDLGMGWYMNADGEIVTDSTLYRRIAAALGTGIPDWWANIYGIRGESGLNDHDNDGLPNYVEYLLSEVFAFATFDPTNPFSADSNTLDYFYPIGRLYAGEMLTDHDQMEDHWERSLGDTKIADASVWDATKDAEEDGWSNFDENRYNEYKMSTLAQLVSHAVGSDEVLDAPIPSIRLTVRYNGSNLSTDKTSATLPNLVVRTFTDDTPSAMDAEFTIQPGTKVSTETYLGGWEDRVVRGTMAPGNIDITSVEIWFHQTVQKDLYSWTDDTGTHISRPYKEFKDALTKNPDIVQNVQVTSGETWLKFQDALNPYGSASSRAVNVARDELTQKGVITVYSERVGTIDLTTGEFEFDMGKMISLTGIIGTFESNPADAWGFKEAVFKLAYSATAPALQVNRLQVSLAKADKGFVKGGKNTIVAFFDNDKSGDYTPGEPFGVLNDVDIGWAGRDVEIELTDMSAVTPRVELWGSSKSNGQQKNAAQPGDGGSAVDASTSDRGVRVGTATFTDGSNRFEVTSAPATVSRVRVARYKVDNFPVYKVGVEAGVVLDKTFDQGVRSYLHEGDFLRDGKLDIDWDNLYDDVVNWQGAQMAACEVTNVTYLIVYNWDADSYRSDADTSTVVKASSTLVTRRFEKTRRIPTTCPERAVCNRAQPTFVWKIENEDAWASWFGTTYTGFKIRVKDLSGNLVYDSGVRRLPPCDSTGVYSWTAPLYVGSVAPGTGVVFKNLTLYTWEVALYNAKFKTDTVMAMEKTGNPFSTPETFRMNVTTADSSSEKLAVRVCYSGPAKSLAGKVRVQAFETPDFTGDPLAELTISGDDLAAGGSATNATLIGLKSGDYFLRAYIDTNTNNVHDAWESWGYLCERDLAEKTSIFNPVSLATTNELATTGVRKLFIEDCDTDGDWFPDVWEAEQNGNVFDRTKIVPVIGNAELIGVNTNLSATLKANLSDTSIVTPLMQALQTRAGVGMMTGISPSSVSLSAAGGFEVEAQVVEETLKIVGLNLDATTGTVKLKVSAEVSGSVDESVAGFLSVTVKKGADVTIAVYHTETLGGTWTQKASGTVTVSEAGADIIVKLDEELPSSGFFKVEIVK